MYLFLKFSDSVFKVRVNAHSAIEMCARNTEGIISVLVNLIITCCVVIAGARGTVAAGLVPLCIERLIEETTSDLKVCKF